MYYYTYLYELKFILSEYAQFSISENIIIFYIHKVQHQSYTQIRKRPSTLVVNVIICYIASVPIEILVVI